MAFLNNKRCEHKFQEGYQTDYCGYADVQVRVEG